MEEKARTVEKLEDAATTISEFEEIVRLKKKNIIWLAYQQGTIFQKFKKREKFSKMVSEFSVRGSTISFKIVVAKLIDDYPKMRHTSLPLHFLKKHMKKI